MKKYILLLLFLTAIVVGPFAYQRWSEAKRLRHIRETKQQAAQIRATPLKDFLQQLDQTSPDQTVLVLFTGNTQAHLEPCGCFIGQSGGLPRRATVISGIRDKGFSPLLVDLGGVLPEDCDGILSLSPLSLGEQIFLKSLSIPFFVRICNETLATDQGINRTLEKYIALREYDALICDASWTAPFFSQLISDTQMNGFHCIPYGVDVSAFRPMNKANAKQQLAQAVGNPKIVDKLLVGVVPGVNVRNATALLRQLSGANPDVHWLVIHPSLEQYFSTSETVSVFSIRNFQDKEASPFVFNALDIAIFPAVLGASSSYLLELAACGILLIVWE